MLTLEKLRSLSRLLGRLISRRFNKLTSVFFVCLFIDDKLRHNIVKVAVGHSRAPMLLGQHKMNDSAYGDLMIP